MTKELDMLLQSIEETGGFRDACTVFQRQKVEELEEGIGSLSEKCGMWRVTIHSYIYFIHVYACEYMDIYFTCVFLSFYFYNNFFVVYQNKNSE